MNTRRYPILEFDPTPTAIIEPQSVVTSVDAPEHCVITFFSEVLEKLQGQGKARIIAHRRWADMDRPLYELEFQGSRLAAFHPGVGAALAGGMLEETIPHGCRKFIACGGCGVLDRDISVGQAIIPTAAVRDEGTSYHYLPPGKEVQAHPEVVSAIERILQIHKVPYRLGKVWTTDAPYRETHQKVRRRRAEGCLAVEMEAAALFAIARFRGVMLGYLLYGGDDVSGQHEWDHRDWYKQYDTRERLFWLAAQACLEL